MQLRYARRGVDFKGRFAIAGAKKEALLLSLNSCASGKPWTVVDPTGSPGFCV